MLLVVCAFVCKSACYAPLQLRMILRVSEYCGACMTTVSGILSAHLFRTWRHTLNLKARAAEKRHDSMIMLAIAMVKLPKVLSRCGIREEPAFVLRNSVWHAGPDKPKVLPNMMTTVNCQEGCAPPPPPHPLPHPLLIFISRDSPDSGLSR